MVELIVVILIIAILSVTALPSLQGTSEYQMVSHRDQFISLLRTIQTRAMQNTQVDSTTCHRILFLSDSAGLAAQNSSGDCSNSLVDVSQRGIDDFLIIEELSQYTARNALPANITHLDFDSWGRPIPSSGSCVARCEITIERLKVCIESEGYIYACE